MKSDKLKPSFGLGWTDDAHATCKTAHGAVVGVMDVADAAYWFRGNRKTAPTDVPSLFEPHDGTQCTFKLTTGRVWDDHQRDCVCVPSETCFEEWTTPMSGQSVLGCKPLNVRIRIVGRGPCLGLER